MTTEPRKAHKKDVVTRGCKPVNGAHYVLWRQGGDFGVDIVKRVDEPMYLTEEQVGWPRELRPGDYLVWRGGLSRLDCFPAPMPKWYTILDVPHD